MIKLVRTSLLSEEKLICTNLVVHKDVHDVQIDLQGPGVVGLVGEQDKLDTKQRNEDECGPNCPHVEAGLSLVGHSQLGDEHAHNVEQEEKVYLKEKQKDLVQHCVQRVRWVQVVDNSWCFLISYHQCSADRSVNDIEQRCV